jgi:hypothetical protein
VSFDDEFGRGSVLVVVRHVVGVVRRREPRHRSFRVAVGRR